MKKTVVLLLGILFFSELIFCQAKEFKIYALKTNNQPLIDGILDEDVWQKAPSVSDFIQFVPDNGEPASLKTVAKILYDDKYIYVSFLCFDPEAEKIEFGTSKRDGLSSQSGTDSVCVMLDTLNDDRSCYYFRTNMLGVQHDGRVGDNGRVADTNWDGIWKSAGARTEEGWSAEMAIPLETVKFLPGKNRTWGIQFSRYLPRRREQTFWTGPLEDYRKISVYGDLTGLDLKGASKKLEIIPHIISKAQEEEKTDFEGGLDARYALSQLISGHLTLNPDFATVEADQEQINLTRFELHLREKRNFFLEGAWIYQQGIRLFYSRRITDIYGATKLYGKPGGYEIGLLTAQTKEEDEEGGSANFSVFRLKRDIMKSSTLGFLAANKLVNGRNQGAFGLDTSLYFSKTFKFAGQLAMSYGKGNKSDLALSLIPSYDSATFHIHLRYSYLGMHFGDNANSIGFIRDDNRHELDSAINKTFWLKKGVLDRIAYNSNYNIYWGMDKTLRSWDVFQGLTFEFKNKFSFGIRRRQEYKLYEKEFRNHSSILELGYNTREWQSVSLSYEFGKNFDSDFTLLRGLIRQNITQDFSFDYILTKLSRSPDPNNQSTWIHVLRATQFFTKDLFLKLFYQINSAIDKRNIQVVFVYRFQPPFGSIQVAYQKGTAKFGEIGTQGHTLFLKWAYVF